MQVPLKNGDKFNLFPLMIPRESQCVKRRSSVISIHGNEAISTIVLFHVLGFCLSLLKTRIHPLCKNKGGGVIFFFYNGKNKNPLENIFRNLDPSEQLTLSVNLPKDALLETGSKEH